MRDSTFILLLTSVALGFYGSNIQEDISVVGVSFQSLIFLASAICLGVGILTLFVSSQKAAESTRNTGEVPIYFYNTKDSVMGKMDYTKMSPKKERYIPKVFKDEKLGFSGIPGGKTSGKKNKDDDYLGKDLFVRLRRKKKASPKKKQTGTKVYTVGLKEIYEKNGKIYSKLYKEKGGNVYKTKKEAEGVKKNSEKYYKKKYGIYSLQANDEEIKKGKLTKRKKIDKKEE